MGNTKKESPLVFLGKKDEVYTTSEIIAGFAGVQHHAVQQLITKHEADLKEFGVIAFEMRKLGGTKRGRFQIQPHRVPPDSTCTSNHRWQY